MKILKVKNNMVDFSKTQHKFFSKIFNKTNHSFKKKSLIISLSLIAAIILPIFPFSTLTFAYEVKYDNVSLGYVAEKSAFEKAETIVNDQTAESISGSAEYSLTLIPENSLNNENELSNSLITNSNLIKAYGIYANGKCIVASKKRKTLLNALESYKTSTFDKYDGDIAVFNKNVEVKECYSKTKDLSTLKQVSKKIKSKIKVNIGVYSTTKQSVNYKTIEKEDKTLYKGAEKTLKEGKKGEKKVKTLTLYQNGKKVSKKTVTNKVTKKAKNEVVAVGTKKMPDGMKNKEYIWPIETGAACHISSGFGSRSGRLHKGIDIIANHGTNILASNNGKVVRASVFESYGYCVDIIHKDGTLTRYAHCSKLLVKVGESVAKGQVIAKVGSTGRSTANHLHFEVRPNSGDPVNPSNYVKK